LRENGCDWNKETCEAAAENGHLSCLQWAKENGCDWGEETCEPTFLNGHFSVLQGARENGCPEYLYSLNEDSDVNEDGYNFLRV